MTQNDIHNGHLICLIAFAPLKPPEFVVFPIRQKRLESPDHQKENQENEAADHWREFFGIC